MPFIPFIGISVLFHLCVIAWCTLFPREARTETHVLIAPLRTLVTGYATIVLIFSLVAFGASSIVVLSLEEPHSSLPAAESAFDASLTLFASPAVLVVTNANASAPSVLPPLDLSLLRDAQSKSELMSYWRRILSGRPQ